MTVRADFNRKAMIDKIKNNNEHGFSLIDIKRELLKEQIENIKKMQALELRNVELQDQLDFINEEYKDAGC